MIICLPSRRHGFDPWVGKIPWRRKWQPTPVFLPGESHERRSLVGYGPRGRKELDTTEWLHFPLGELGLVSCIGFMLGRGVENCTCLLLEWDEFFTSDGYGHMRWCVLGCLWTACLLRIGFVSLSLLFGWCILHCVLHVVRWCWVLDTGGELCGSSLWLLLLEIRSSLMV